MLLQNNFDLQLEKFFRIFDAKFASKICGPFCVCLKKKRHPIECDFDNVVDGNSISSGAQDVTTVLARAAKEHDYQFMFLVRNEAFLTRQMAWKFDTTHRHVSQC